MKWLVYLFLVFLLYLSSNVEGQIPKECFNDDSLRGDVRMCCPNNCSYSSSNPSESRGRCVNVTGVRSDTDPRIDWPICYFTHVCRCEERFGGVGCESCGYGYHGDNCQKNTIYPRRNLKNARDNWPTYRNILKLARETDSGYVAIVNGAKFNPEEGISSIEDEVRNVSIYNFFVWTHYLVAKDSERKGGLKKDFAHESTGFLTWHRQMLLWLEWKIQEMLREKGSYQNPHQFRLSYWDWTDKSQRNAHFKDGQLGATLYTDRNDTTYNHVVHDTNQTADSQLFGTNGTNWETICWSSKKGADGSPCDPDKFTGYLKRCPRHRDTNVCDPQNQYWPTKNDVKTALNIVAFDTSSYSLCSERSFRNFLEGFSVISECNEDVDKMCSEAKDAQLCNRARTLHNSAHLILGAGNLRNVENSDKNDDEIKSDNLGIMSHVAASPNDPIFINHHAMIDCIFEEWLKRNPTATYPNNEISIKPGHRKYDYIVPFMPVFTHNDMFKRANNFGYSCDLSQITGGDNNKLIGPIVGAAGILAIATIIVILCAIYCCSKKTNNKNKHKQINHDGYTPL